MLDPKIQRRHLAAMVIIGDVPPDKRPMLLWYVLFGSPGIDRAVEEAEAAGVPMGRRGRPVKEPAYVA